MQFRVLFADDGHPASTDIYPDAKAAEAAASAIRAENPGRAVRLARVVTDAWRAREAARLADGTYTPLPAWWGEMVPGWAESEAARDHYAHLASDRERLAYTASPEKGEADAQTVIAAERYLARYFPDIAPHTARDIAARLRADRVRVKVGFNPDDFERGYRNSPDVRNESSGSGSCMRSGNLSHRLPHHPARVFGAGDLAIAYIEPTPGEVTARAVIWPDEQTFVRVYGDGGEEQNTLRAWLEANGYRRADSFRGARLLKTPALDGYLMPYVDGDEAWAGDYGDRFVIGEGEGISLKETRGYAESQEEEEEQAPCENCDDYVAPYELGTVFVIVGRLRHPHAWCTSCRDYHAFTCDATGDLYPDNVAVTVYTATGEQSWNRLDAERHAFECAWSEERYCADTVARIQVYDAQGRAETWADVPGNAEDRFFCPMHHVWFDADAADISPDNRHPGRVEDARQPEFAL